MYNFLVASGETAWDDGVYEYDRSRVAVEYTDDSISERYKELDADVVDELKGLPCVFCVEGEKAPSRLGWLTNVKVKRNVVRIEFEFEESLEPFENGFFGESKILFELGRFELGRTHWAIKDGDLWALLEKRGIKSNHLRPENQIPSSDEATEPIEGSLGKVFIVHGHDDVAKYEAAAELKNLGCEPVILHEQPSAGLTIIEKIEKFTDVGFAVVLYTPCDIGGKSEAEIKLTPRARQNVVFEHGYLIAKLGRGNVVALVRGKIEPPSDVSGVVYITLDEDEEWKSELKRELEAAGYKR